SLSTMATLQDLGVSAAINILSAFAFLLAFALLRIQPINDRVYFPKWYISGGRSNPRSSGNFVGKFVNLNVKTYLTFLNWMPQALRMSETEIINHAGLDSAVFLRIYTLGLKMFLPVTIVALLILIPVNVSSGTLFFLRKELVVSDIDKLSISNVPPKSLRFFVHIGLEYMFTIWICFLLYKEYDNIALMRLHFLASQRRRAEQFTVVVRNVPHISGHSVSDSVDGFFQTNHPDHYIGHQAVYNANRFAKFVRKRDRFQNWLDYYRLKFQRNPDKRPTMKTGCLGLWGRKVDAIEYYDQHIKELDKLMTLERQKIIKDPKSILPVAFLSFNSRWGASVCAQTQQSKNPTLWLTDWAPEPRDIYWRNLAIPFVSLTVRKLIITLSVFALVFFYMIPIAFVQSLANLDGLERVAPFLRPVIELKFIKSFLQGFLPGLALKIFLYILPTVLMIMSKIEGYIALSTLERKTAAKYYYFMLVNVFLGSIITGTAFEQLHAFLHQSPTQIPRTIGVSIPMKATFFMTYIMLKPREIEERPWILGLWTIPKLFQAFKLYFLLGIVYAVVTPILLPFILVTFAFTYSVYRQIIKVYNQQYESAAAFWPQVHSRIIASLIISQLLLLGLLSTKKAARSTPLLVLLPILTFAFHKYCKNRFEPAFRKYHVEEAMTKDILEKTTEPDLNIKAYLADTYLHPILRSSEVEEEELVELETVQVRVDKLETHHVASQTRSESSSPSPPHDVHHQHSPPHHVHQHQPSPPHYNDYPLPPEYYYHHTSPPH
ncbi:putative membrane protein, partial [Trifolium pratense]